MHQGELAQAIELFEHALALYDPERHRDDAFYYAQNPGVAMRCFAAWTLWLLGQADKAMEQIEEALRLARELREPHGLAQPLFFAAMLHQFRREPEMAQERAEAAIAVASDNEIGMYHAMATITRGWALREQGRETEAIEQMRQGLVAYEATGAEVIRPHFLAMLGEALGKAGQVEEGLGLLEEAFKVAWGNGDVYYEAELYRLKGELLLMQSAGRGASLAAPTGKAVVESKSAVMSQAESCFRQALETSQRQQAKALALRAAMSLARLYQQQGRAAEGQALLSQIYQQFTEGFETVDLREAKALLNELS
jgi:adenylate cyclase